MPKLDALWTTVAELAVRVQALDDLAARVRELEQRG